jgi:acyl-CoA dehydrogenase
MLKLIAHTSNPGWNSNVAAAKAFIDGQAVRLGHEAIQMHGAMGLTDELAVSHHHKRVFMNAMSLGDRRAHVDAFIAHTSLTSTGAASCALHFPDLLDTDEARFREEVRAFLETALTDELRLTARRLTCTFPEKEPSVEWQKRLNARGWLAPLWPTEHGGTGWSAVERFIFEYECAVGGAPERTPMGFRYVGPVLAHFGSEWQQSRFLPPLLASEHYWAQGFSEPGAGSDLAALKTTAMLDGDEYVVNGSKIWTTNAHMADWIFCLVRTSQTDRPQDGISFLLIDLKTPGIRIEPIALLAVDHEVNQVFFDDVHVPASHLVGEPGKGWQYAKFLLELERGGSVTCGRLRAELNLAKELLATTRSDLTTDAGVMRRLAWLEIRLMALEALEFDCARATTRATDPGVAGSMTKLVSSELQEEITEFGVEVAGPAGLEFTTTRPIPDSLASGYPGSDLERVAMPRYLNTRATTIFAGSSEVQREIISKHVLGLRG